MDGWTDVWMAKSTSLMKSKGMLGLFTGGPLAPCENICAHWSERCCEKSVGK